RCNTDVEFTSAPPPGPGLYRTKQTRGESADERGTEKRSKRQRAGNSRRQQESENRGRKARGEGRNSSARE
ncbi:hypothetical protein C3R44_22545, partial [Mycobacterium tuberculosis]